MMYNQKLTTTHTHIYIAIQILLKIKCFSESTTGLNVLKAFSSYIYTDTRILFISIVDSFEYPKTMFWLRNFEYELLSGGLTLQYTILTSAKHSSIIMSVEI